ncbi:MAG: LamG domain-containing protein, partial [Planctomycetota bacterium]
MPQAIIYCDRCGKIIPPGEHGRGQAIVSDDGGICPSCVATLTPEQRDELRLKLTGQAPAVQPPQPPRSSRTTAKRRRTSTRTTAVPQPAPDAGGGHGKHIAIVGAVAGVIVGIAVALLVASGPSGGPTPAPIAQHDSSAGGSGDETPTATGSGGAVATATATAAQRRLAEIKGWVDGLPDRYSEIRDALTRFPRQYPGAPETEQAKALLAEADASFGKLADAELEKAIAEAKARALGDKPGDAETVLAELRARFTGTAWFETRGRQAMDDADMEVIQLVVSSVEIRAGKLLGRAEEAFDAGDVRAARDIVYSKVWSKQLLPRAGKLARKVAAAEAGGDAAAGVTKGLVGWWKFDEADGFVAADSSGGARNAEVRGATWEPKGGRVGGAMRFNGTGGHVRASEGFSDFSGGLTIALWARPTAAARYARFIDFANGSPGDNFLLTREGTSSGLLLEVYRGGKSQGKVHARGVIEDNTWQHFTATIDADGRATIYRDGEQVASGNLPTPKVVARSLNYIGRSQWGQDEWYEGLMDDLRIYDRALSSEEARALWSGAPAGAVVADAAKETDAPPKRDEAGALAAGLVGWWMLDEGAGRTATDSSGTGN